MAKPEVFHPEYSLLPATGARARHLGVMHYFTGKKCSRGHISPRYASSGNCAQCIAERKGNAYINFRGKSSKRSAENQILAEEAIAGGKTTYFALTQCPHGHSERFVNSNSCVECSRLNMQKRKEESKWKRIEKLYGVTKSIFDLMLKDQDHKCAICESEIKESAHIDHCHTDGHVRGLLCSRCNQAIGLLDEDTERMKKAVSYIRRSHDAVARLSRA